MSSFGFQMPGVQPSVAISAQSLSTYGRVRAMLDLRVILLFTSITSIFVLPLMAAGTERVSCSDGPLLEKLVRHVASPHGLVYTEELKGDPDPDTIGEHSAYVMAVMKVCPPHGAIVQSALANALHKHAKANEESWHLGSEEKIRAWATKQARMRRAMVRHFDAAVGKVTVEPPQWVKDVYAAAKTAGKRPAAAMAASDSGGK